MKDRIKKYMDYKSISAGELSSLIEVQRSNISHILNGRNLPGATFIEKLLMAFPDLNARWLMTGKGEMVEKIEKPETKSITSEKLLEKSPKSEPVSNLRTISQINSSPIDKIVILYSNGTFADYNKR